LVIGREGGEWWVREGKGVVGGCGWMDVVLVLGGFVVWWVWFGVCGRMGM
jgi:hypothetical protein